MPMTAILKVSIRVAYYIPVTMIGKAYGASLCERNKKM
jgi:hypothetical protein